MYMHIHIYVYIYTYTSAAELVRLRVSSHSTGIERQTKQRIDLQCF